MAAMKRNLISCAAAFSISLILALAFAVPASAGTRVVCIGAFEDLGGTKETYWLGPLIIDSISRNFAVFPEFKVAQRMADTGSSDGACSPEVDFRISGFFRCDGDSIYVGAHCVPRNESLAPSEASIVSSFSELYAHLAELSDSLVECMGAKHSTARLGRARCEQTDSRRAMSFYGKALASPPDSRERGLLLLKAISNDPSYCDALAGLGIYHHLGGNSSEALVAFEKLAKVAPDYPRLHYNMGLVHRARGEYPRAIEMYRKALEVEPRDPDTWNNLGATYYLAKLYEEAVEAYERALEIDPENQRIRANLTRASEAGAPKPEEKSSLRVNLDMLRQRVDAGAAFYTIGDYWRAAEELEEALEIDPENFIAHNNIALTYLELGERAKAKKHFKRALEINPTAESVVENLAKLEFVIETPPTISEQNQKKPETPLSPLQRSGAFSAAGKIYLSRGSYEQAIEAFTQALEFLPGDINAIIGLGSAYFGYGEYEKALAQFKAAAARRPEAELARQRLAETEYVLEGISEKAGQGYTFKTEARACLVRGNWLGDEGRHEEAVSQYLKALSLAPAMAETLNNLANAYFVLGRHEEAREVLRKARMLEPANEFVGRNIELMDMPSEAGDGGEPVRLEVFHPGERQENEIDITPANPPNDAP